MFLKRVMMECARPILPSMTFSASLVAFSMCLLVAFHSSLLVAALLIAPVAALTTSLGVIAATAIVKRLLMGRFKPGVAPLWSWYIWRNEIVNGLYESAAAPAMMPLMGTPFLGPCLRVMGCKVGRWVFLESTLFSEFDLVSIGDYAALNLGATVQTHLFEDRVMKTDYLDIGACCSVGNMSVVLYGTQMQPGSRLGPLSLLMKGEILPPSTVWQGVPTRATEMQKRGTVRDIVPIAA